MYVYIKINNNLQTEMVKGTIDKKNENSKLTARGSIMVNKKN